MEVVRRLVDLGGIAGPEHREEPEERLVAGDAARLFRVEGGVEEGVEAGEERPDRLVGVTQHPQ